MGGGIFCCNSSPTIRKNVISGNFGEAAAGGICSKNYSAPLITENQITENTVQIYWGGGIFCPSSAATITYNIICHNTADQGGGLCCSSLPSQVRGNLIYGNSAVQEGGGVYDKKSNSTYANNLIYSNTAHAGGGIYCFESSPITTNNTIFGNHAVERAGGIGGIQGYYPAVMNSIIWGNTPDQVNGIIQVSYCNVEGGFPVGPGNLNANPRFVDSATHDFHLQYHSPCRNTGWNHGPGLPDVDFEDDPRIVDGNTDMGADEFYVHLYYTGEAHAGGDVKIKITGTPLASPVFLWLGSGKLDPPFPSPYGDWLLAFPVLLTLNLNQMPSPGGALVLPFTIPLDVPTPIQLHLQALVGDHLSNLCVLAIT
jgi:hypothetical protein